MAESEVAVFRKQQILQEQAAQRGLHGYAQVSRHDIITARLERGAEDILRLLEQGRHEEAYQLWNMPAWGLEEEAIRHTARAVSSRQAEDTTL